MRTASVLIALAACNGSTDTPCDRLARASIELTITDDGGEPLPQAEAEYVHDGFDPVDCDDLDGDGLRFACGYEIMGPVLVTADAWGFDPQTIEVDVDERDRCHVITESVTMLLQPVNCTDEEVPSLRVVVVDSSGGSIPDAAASFVPSDEDWTQPEPCDKQDLRTFTCGGEYPGQIDLWVTGTGYEDHFEVVDVREDECGVVTTDVTVVMKPT